MSDAQRLNIYLNDHLAGSDVALELLTRLADSAGAPEIRDTAATLHDEIQSDQRILRDLIAALGGNESHVKRALGWLAEKAARLKFGSSAEEDGFALFESLELLALGIEGKCSLWRALATIADREPVIRDLDLGALLERAHAQHDEVELLRLALAPDALLGG
jgi:hypothetical protein